MSSTPKGGVSAADPTSSSDAFRHAVLEGLARAPAAVPCKFLYDARGSELFEQICTLEEYYPTRTETAIMQAYVTAMAAAVGPHALVVEYGSGSSRKTTLLLDALEAPAGYVPIDISPSALAAAAARLRARYPALPIHPVSADYTEPLTLPAEVPGAGRRLVYFPGSTVGNFEPRRVVPFLRRMARLVGEGGFLLIGVDLRKDVRVLEAAYDDREGVTAAFNKNLLRRINRELDADFDLDGFAHQALYDTERHCIEMRLVSRAGQRVHVGGETFEFAEGDYIRTERSYKYSFAAFERLAREAGFVPADAWTDAGELFSVQLYRVAED